MFPSPLVSKLFCIIKSSRFRGVVPLPYSFVGDLYHFGILWMVLKPMCEFICSFWLFCVGSVVFVLCLHCVLPGSHHYQWVINAHRAPQNMPPTRSGAHKLPGASHRWTAPTFLHFPFREDFISIKENSNERDVCYQTEWSVNLGDEEHWDQCKDDDEDDAGDWANSLSSSFYLERCHSSRGLDNKIFLKIIRAFKSGCELNYLSAAANQRVASANQKPRGR